MNQWLKLSKHRKAREKVSEGAQDALESIPLLDVLEMN